MNWKLLRGLVCLLLLPIVGYRMSLVAAAPEATLHQGVACPGQPPVAAQDVQVLAVRKWSKGVVALYRGLCPGDRHEAPAVTLQPVLSYRVVKQRGREWQLEQSGNQGTPTTNTKPSRNRYR